MLNLLIVAIVLGVVFGLLGFTKISVGFMGIARILFIVIVILLLVALIGDFTGVIVL